MLIECLGFNEHIRTQTWMLGSLWPGLPKRCLVCSVIVCVCHGLGLTHILFPNMVNGADRHGSRSNNCRCEATSLELLHDLPDADIAPPDLRGCPIALVLRHVHVASFSCVMPGLVFGSKSKTSQDVVICTSL